LHFGRVLAQEGRHITNIVLMGMGEPLLNYEAVRQMLRVVSDPAGLGLGGRRFTLSTAGIIPGIERLAEDDLGVRLAISLHAPDDALRTKLIPLNRRYPLASSLPNIPTVGLLLSMPWRVASMIPLSTPPARLTCCAGCTAT
jgi:23S rRNA (adenine2503-C2)-methyltransferase